MREVEASRFVPESPAVVRRGLSPERIVEWERSFSVADAASVDEETTLVTVTGPGVGFRLRFERRSDGYRYAVDDDEDVPGPFDHLETWLTVEAEDEGSRVTFRSIVALNAPIPFADRIAAWKRRGELCRALDGLVETV
ncbi:polyketide cyclase [Halobacteriales archaeon SW_8_68_21]|nr:MAG: polyketide cyclase [Halobacteriales archaeon SW_8_68_21]